MSKLIVVDPGHGGADSGAVNGSKREKDATLILGKKVTNRLRNAGYKVTMTRNTDKALTLQQRCDISNREGAALFISIHCNSATNKAAEGIETFKAKSVQSLTHKFAENVQNAMIKATGAKDRCVKSENFYVLRNTKAPAVLVEVGFISHKVEAEKLFNTEYQNKIADALVSGIKETLPA